MGRLLDGNESPFLYMTSMTESRQFGAKGRREDGFFAWSDDFVVQT